MPTITLKAADGHRFTAYTAGQPDAHHALVVVQEIFGVNHHIRAVCERFANHGFSVIAPALFDRIGPGHELGYTEKDIAEGRALRAQVPDEGTVHDIRAAAAHLHAHHPQGRKIGIVGYCWGGTVAWWGATRTHDFAAAVSWYGGGIAGTRTELPRCPVQMHFGELDASIPMRDVEAIGDAQPTAEIYVYDGAQHGFGCDERPSFSKPDADLAQERTLDFFARHLA
jgi:carboxymethylenebutenolidase